MATIVTAQQPVSNNDGYAPAGALGLPSELDPKILDNLDGTALVALKRTNQTFRRYILQHPYIDRIDHAAREFTRWIINPQDPWESRLINGLNQVLKTHRLVTHV